MCNPIHLQGSAINPNLLWVTLTTKYNTVKEIDIFGNIAQLHKTCRVHVICMTRLLFLNVGLHIITKQIFMSAKCTAQCIMYVYSYNACKYIKMYMKSTLHMCIHCTHVKCTCTCVKATVHVHVPKKHTWLCKDMYMYMYTVHAVHVQAWTLSYKVEAL